jgi:hypothetical protein
VGTNMWKRCASRPVRLLPVLEASATFMPMRHARFRMAQLKTSRLARRNMVYLVVVLVCAALPTPALGASAEAHDAQATGAYLHALEAYVPVTAFAVGEELAAMEVRESEVARQCPSALTYAPRDAAFEELGEELSTAQWYAGVAPIRSSLLRMANAIEHLSWSEHRLTELVHEEAREELADAAVVLPDVCGEIEAWKASGFAVLPSGVSAFLDHVEAIEASSTVGISEEPREQLIARLLARYETPTGRKLAERLERLERQSNQRRIAGGETARKKLVAAMGVAEL